MDRAFDSSEGVDDGGGGGGGGGSPPNDASKLFSTSYFKPRSLATYENFMRAVNNEGFLEVKQTEEEEWKRRYCVLKDGALNVHKEPPSKGKGGGGAREGGGNGAAEIAILLDMVASVRSADQYGECAFQIITPDQTYYFRALSKPDMQEWLFAFHRSLAVIVARLVDNTGSAAPAARDNPRLVDKRLRMMQELGHGHGRSLSVTRRFRQASNCEEVTTGSSLLPGAGGGGGMPLRENSGSLGGVRRRGTEFTVADPQGIFATSMRAGMGSGQVGLMMGNRQASPTRIRVTEPTILSFAAARPVMMSTAPDRLGRLQHVERVELEIGGGGEGGACQQQQQHQHLASLSPTTSSSSSILGKGESLSSEHQSVLDNLTLEDRGDSTGTGVSEGEAHHQAAPSGGAGGSGAGRRNLSIDLSWQRRARADGEGSVEDDVPLPLPTPSPMSSVGGGYGTGSQILGCGDSPCDDGTGLMFEMSMEEVEVTALSVASGLSLLTASRLSPGDTVVDEVLAAIPFSAVLQHHHQHPSLIQRASSSSTPTTSNRGRGGEEAVINGATSTTASLRKPPGRHGLGWTVGLTSLQGIRNHQEDQYTAIADLNAIFDIDSPDLQAFYAIYDGHCGVRAARYAKDLLHEYLVQDPTFLTRPDEAMTRTCRRVDREVLEMCQRESLYCGTTAIVALIRGRKVVIGNLGDCAAVLCRGRQAIALSTAQTPGRPDEVERIERANGWVTTEKELFVGQLHRMDLADPIIAQAVEKRVQWVTIYRVCGELSVSRSIGDPDFKGITAAIAAAAAAAASFEQETEEGGAGREGGGDGVASGGVGLSSDFPFDFPPGHSGLFHADLVIADPEIVESDITDKDHFLLLACDGFWDVLDGQEAVDRALEFLGSGMNASEAAARLGDLALRLGSSDNVTVLLIVFEHDGEEEGNGKEKEEIVVDGGDGQGRKDGGGEGGGGEGGGGTEKVRDERQWRIGRGEEAPP